MTSTLLIVGGAGFIGSACAHFLHQLGYQIVVLDNLETGSREAVQAPLIVGDIRNQHDVESVFSSYSIDAVLHFAGKIHPLESTRKPIDYFNVNTYGTMQLVSCMLKYGVRKLLFSSTAAVYGENHSTPIKEVFTSKPTTPYGVSKWMAEVFLSNMMQYKDLQVTCLRYFNAAGAIPSLKIGERSPLEKHLIPIAIDAATGKIPHLKIYGTDYPTSDGTCIRDYVHVQDLAEAHHLALQELENGGSGEVYNVGTGLGHSVIEVVDEISRYFKRPTPIENHARRLGDPPFLVTDPSKIKSRLGWKPKYSDLPNIISSAIQWNQING